MSFKVAMWKRRSRFVLWSTTAKPPLVSFVRFYRVQRERKKGTHTHDTQEKIHPHFPHHHSILGFQKKKKRREEREKEREKDSTRENYRVVFERRPPRTTPFVSTLVVDDIEDDDFDEEEKEEDQEEDHQRALFFFREGKALGSVCKSVFVSFVGAKLESQTLLRAEPPKIASSSSSSEEEEEEEEEEDL